MADQTKADDNDGSESSPPNNIVNMRKNGMGKPTVTSSGDDADHSLTMLQNKMVGNHAHHQEPAEQSIYAEAVALDVVDVPIVLSGVQRLSEEGRDHQRDQILQVLREEANMLANKQRRQIRLAIMVGLCLFLAATLGSICGSGYCRPSNVEGRLQPTRTTETAGNETTDDEQPPTSAPTGSNRAQSEIDAIVEHFNLVTMTNRTLLYPSDDTPEERALTWLIDSDPFQLQIPRDKDRMLRRYVLLVSWYSKQDELPPTIQAGGDERNWEGVSGLYGPTHAGFPISGITLYYKGTKEASIPLEVILLKDLRYLQLEGPSLVGTIPSEIGSLQQMTSLLLNSSSLTGVVPEELYNMTNLLLVHIGDNQLRGTLSSSVGRLSALEFFDISRNQFTGTLPPELERLSDITGFFVEDNDFHGTIPKNLSTWQRVQRAFFQQNNFSGSLPFCADDGRLDRTSLEQLGADCNMECSCCLKLSCPSS